MSATQRNVSKHQPLQYTFSFSSRMCTVRRYASCYITTVPSSCTTAHMSCQWTTRCVFLESGRQEYQQLNQQNGRKMFRDENHSTVYYFARTAFSLTTLIGIVWTDGRQLFVRQLSVWTRNGEKGIEQTSVCMNRKRLKRRRLGWTPLSFKLCVAEDCAWFVRGTSWRQ